jgi:hypothetical protein
VREQSRLRCWEECKRGTIQFTLGGYSPGKEHGVGSSNTIFADIELVVWNVVEDQGGHCRGVSGGRGQFFVDSPDRLAIFFLCDRFKDSELDRFVQW